MVGFPWKILGKERRQWVWAPPSVSQQSSGFPCSSHWSYIPEFRAEQQPRKVPPGAIRPLYYPSTRNLMKEAPASSLGRITRLCGERQWKTGLEVSSVRQAGAVREASPGYALPRTAVSQVPQQRASSTAHADLDVTQFWVWSLPLLSMH